MTCEDIILDIDDYLDGILDTGRISVFQQHIHECESCRLKLENEQQWRRDLRDLPVTPPGEDFARRVMSQARRRNRKFHGQSFAVGFGSALAAGLAVLLIAGQFLLPTVPEVARDSLKTVNITLYETKKVILAFDSPREMGNAKVSLSLPENAELEGFPGQRKISWQTDLQQGRNLLALPIKATQLSQGELEARIEHEGKAKTIKIILHADKPDLTFVGDSGQILI